MCLNLSTFIKMEIIVAAKNVNVQLFLRYWISQPQTSSNSLLGL